MEARNLLPAPAGAVRVELVADEREWVGLIDALEHAVFVGTPPIEVAAIIRFRHLLCDATQLVQP